MTCLLSGIQKKRRLIKAIHDLYTYMLLDYVTQSWYTAGGMCVDCKSTRSRKLKLSRTMKSFLSFFLYS